MNTQQFKEITNRQKELLKSCNICQKLPELKMEVQPKVIKVFTYGCVANIVHSIDATALGNKYTK